MIILQCFKCGQCSYLEINKSEIKEKQDLLCKACGKPEKKTRTRVFEIPTPYQGWKAQ